MSKVKIEGNASGTGTFTIAAPNSNSDRTLNLPDVAGDIATAATYTATIEGSSGTTDWTGSDPYTATVTVSGLLTTDEPVMDIDMSSVSFADVADVQADWALVYRAEVSAADTLKLYATAEPASSFDVILKVTR